MPYQNRVDPFGTVCAVEPHGLFTGNRGIIHDPASRSLLKRRWSSKAWIICDPGFRNRKRDVMGANGPNGSPGWTNLFFLDEATALAAGHRPCFYCRRRAAQDFAGRFGDAFGIASPKAPEIDARLHDERLASGGAPRGVSISDLPSLPAGTLIASDAQAWMIADGQAFAWSHSGYGPPQPLTELAKLSLVVLTPPTSLAVLRAGYSPVLHPSAA